MDGDWWRYLAAPWVYPDVSYLFVISVGVVIFGSLVESRVGTVATAVLMVACGALGMLAADGIEGAIGDADHIMLAAGGNGVALGLLSAWAALKAGELRSQPDDDFDLIGAAACAVVLIALPPRGGLRERLRRPGGRAGRRGVRLRHRLRPARAAPS